MKNNDKKIKVLHVLGSMNVGGIQMFLMNMFRKIDREKMMFDFACMNHKNYFQQEIEELGGRLFCVGSHKRILQHRKFLYKILNENQYDYIHIHSGNALCVIDSILVKKYAPDLKVIYHSHNSSHKEKLLHEIMKPLIPAYNDFLFACSEEAARWMYPKATLSKRKYTIISNGIDVEKFLYSEKSALEIRSEFGIEDDFVVGHVGRIDTQKNHKFLLEIFAVIVEKKPNAKLLLVGTGPLEQEIRKLASNLNIKDIVLFLGTRNDVERVLCACDVFVFPSLHEGLPLTLIEAESSGLPCYISDVISDEAVVSPLVFKESLETPAKVWAEKICMATSNDRTWYNQIVGESQYSVYHTIRQISDLYEEARKA